MKVYVSTVPMYAARILQVGTVAVTVILAGARKSRHSSAVSTSKDKCRGYRDTTEPTTIERHRYNGENYENTGRRVSKSATRASRLRTADCNALKAVTHAFGTAVRLSLMIACTSGRLATEPVPDFQNNE